MTRSLVPLALLVSLAFSAAGAVVVAGPERELTEPIAEIAATSQYAGRIASDGNSFLAVWVEGGRSSSAIHATRLTADGVRVDDTPLVIADSAAVENDPQVTWGAGRYLVVWTTGREILGRFVDPQGVMSDVITITSPPYPGVYNPRVAFNGHLFMVVWTESPRAHAALLDASGTIVRTITLVETAQTVEVTAAGGVFYLAWWRYAGEVMTAEIVVARVFEDDQMAAPIVVDTMKGNVADLSLASHGSEVMIAWTAVIDGTTHELRSARVTGGTATSVETLSIGQQTLDTLVADRNGFVLVYGDDSTRHALRSGTSFAIPTLPRFSRVLSGASGANGPVLIAMDLNGYDLYAQPLSEARFEPLAIAERNQAAPAIGAMGAIKLVVWTEYLAAEHDWVLVGQRLGPGGEPLDETPFTIAANERSSGARIRVVSNGKEWLVVWQGTAELLGMRVAPSGALLDAAPFRIVDFLGFGGEPDVSWDGESWVVIYTKGVVSRIGSNFTVLYTRVHPDGRVDPPDTMLSDNRSNFGPAIASSQQSSLVVWTETKERVLRGVLLGKSGSITPISFPTGGAQAGAAVTWNGERFLVAVPTIGKEIHWLFVSATGVVTETPAWTTYEPLVYGAAAIELAPLGSDFLIAFRSGTEIRAATINGNGYLEGPATAVANTAVYERAFDLSGTTIVYARSTDPLRDLLTRVFSRELAIVPNEPKRRAVR